MSRMVKTTVPPGPKTVALTVIAVFTMFLGDGSFKVRAADNATPVIPHPLNAAFVNRIYP